MTDAINFFQMVFSKNNFSINKTNRAEIRLANALKKDARKFATEAKAEKLNAEKAQKIALESEEKKDTRNFAEIALWHSLLAFGKYRQAAARFNEAAAFETGKQKEFSKNAKQMSKYATEAENAVNFLTEFLS